MGKYYYFPEVDLNLCAPANVKRHLAESGWLKNKIKIESDTFPLIRDDGQLDPLLVTTNSSKTKWIVEPGQSRWYCLKYLDRDTTFLLVKVEDDEQEFFDEYFKGQDYREIKTYDEAILLFGYSDIFDHRSLGFLRRRGWFMETKHKDWGTQYSLIKDSNYEVCWLDVNKDSHSSWHRHQHQYNLIGMIEGRLELKFEDTNKVLRNQQWFIIPPGMWHKFITDDEYSAKCVEVMYVKYDTNDIERKENG